MLTTLQYFGAQQHADHFTEHIGQLMGLQQSKLHNNQLTTLPECIRQLTGVAAIKLQQQPADTLPVGIGQLTVLQEL